MSCVINYNNEMGEIREQISDFLEIAKDDETFFQTLLQDMVGGHAKESHIIDCDDMDSRMVERIINEDKKFVSAFTDEKKSKEAILNLIQNKENLNNIVNWMQKERRDFERPRDYSEYAFTGLNSNNIGRGYTNNFVEKETCAVRIVLQRNREASLGFGVKTAYPDINDKNAKETGFILNKENILTNKNLNGLTTNKKLYIAAKASEKGEFIKYNAQEDSLKMIFDNKVKAFFDKDKFSIKISTDEGQKPVKLEDIKEFFPYAHNRISEILELRKELIKNQVKVNDNKSLEQKDRNKEKNIISKRKSSIVIVNRRTQSERNNFNELKSKTSRKTAPDAPSGYDR